MLVHLTSCELTSPGSPINGNWSLFLAWCRQCPEPPPPPLKPHGELPFPASTVTPRAFPLLPLAPLELPRPLIARVGPHPRRSEAPSGRQGLMPPGPSPVAAPARPNLGIEPYVRAGRIPTFPRPVPPPASSDSGEDRRRPPQGPNCRLPDLSRVFCANQEYSCEYPKLSMDLCVVSFFPPLCVLSSACKIDIKP
jgi:hypothetical protein